jgi:hypothetical protein
VILAQQVDDLLPKLEAYSSNRSHPYDDGLSQWSREMPPKPEPRPPLTAAEIERKIGEALAEYHEGKQIRPLTREVVAATIHEICKQVRASLPTSRQAEIRFDQRVCVPLAEVDKLQRGPLPALKGGSKQWD